MIRGVFFDASGVLYDRQVPTRRYALGLLAARGHHASTTDEDRAHLRAVGDRAATGKIPVQEYWDAFLVTHGVADAAEREELVGLIMEQTREVIGLPGAGATLAGLRARGFVIGIVTDTMYPLEWKMGWLEAAGAAGLIDVIACSTVVGVRKPAPQIYLNALQQAEIAPAEAMFVGHDTVELEGARALGMVTAAVYHDEGAPADYHLKELRELLELPVLARAPRRQRQP